MAGWKDCCSRREDGVGSCGGGRLRIMRLLVGATMTLWTLVIASVVYPLLAHVAVARGKNVGDIVTEIRIERTVYISPDWCANAELAKAYPAQIAKGHTTVHLRVGQSTCKYHI